MYILLFTNILKTITLFSNDRRINYIIYSYQLSWTMVIIYTDNYYGFIGL